MIRPMNLVALTRDVSPSLAQCELTHLDRVAIDVDRARRQHEAYRRALIAAGCRVEELQSTAEMPDSVFVEDAAVVFDELAIITRPGARSRRIEIGAVAEALGRWRPLRRIEAPGIVDGGDVLVAGRRVFVGITTRTNDHAVAQMRAILTPHRYTVCAVAIADCLHLKSAVTALDDVVLLLNPDWVSADAFRGFEIIEIDSHEPFAANALRLPDRVIFPSAFPRTADRIRARGYRVELVDSDELAKAEGGVTCCSLIVSLG